MNIHEYQAKQLLREYGIAVPRGGVAFTVEEAATQAQELGGPIYVVKSQIHAGGRGAGRFKNNPDGKGGVRIVKSVEEVRESVREMLGQVLVTKQTGQAGKDGQFQVEPHFTEADLFDAIARVNQFEHSLRV